MSSSWPGSSEPRQTTAAPSSTSSTTSCRTGTTASSAPTGSPPPRSSSYTSSATRSPSPFPPSPPSVPKHPNTNGPPRYSGPRSTSTFTAGPSRIRGRSFARAENDPDHPLHGYFKDYKDIRASIESVGGFLGPDGLLTTLSPPKGPTQTVTQTVIPAEAGTQRGGVGRGSHPIPLLTAHPEPGEAPEANSPVIPAKSPAPEQSGAGTHPAHPEPGERHEANSPVVPAEAGTHPRPEPAEGTQDYKVRRTRKQRRRDGAARAATLGKHPSSERNNEEKQDKPAPVDLTPAERRIKGKLERHWHEPDPWAGPIDSTTPGRSPPW